MSKLVLASGSMLLVLFSAGAALPQQIDAVPLVQNRSPSTVADQISDPAERAAFLALYKKTPPTEMLAHAQAFLQQFPQSVFLAQAYDIAARSSFDLQDYKRGLEYAQQSLALLPENATLLVAVADVEARLHLNDAAVSHARDALEYLDRFGRPGSIAAAAWPGVKRKLQASANFALGRALLAQALAVSMGEKRADLLKQCQAALIVAETLNSGDAETTYLSGLARLSAGDLTGAAGEFAIVCRENNPFSAQAREHLESIRRTLAPQTDFDSFLRGAKRPRLAEPPPALPPAKPLSAYVGSAACRDCHAGIYKNWSETGMGRMLRPYQPQNILGDFQNNNQFYEGDQVRYRDRKLEVVRSEERSLYARMVMRDGRHYFQLRQSDGTWHSYPVDYTIGSKFQQAYAVKLPNGQIHVFPIQYNVEYKQWLNYWKLIDDPGSERSDLHSWEKLDSATSYQFVCAVCHTSQLRNVTGGGFGPDNLQFREPGVDCEMCHGPSARHIAEMKNGEDYEKGPLDPPVDFHRISNRDFVRICSQCHMQSAIREPGPQGELNYSPKGRFFMTYRSIPFDEFSRKGFYKDGRFRQTTFIVESLERSQCFKKGGVSCGTCHNPHGHNFSSNRKSLKFPGDSDKMCTGCHAQFQDSAKLAAHSHHAAGSEASRCVSCHMPRIMESLLFRARYHQIDDIPNADMTLRFGRDESPNACLLCHSEKDARWVKQELVSWKDGH